jgi:hypothetical protein
MSFWVDGNDRSHLYDVIDPRTVEQRSMRSRVTQHALMGLAPAIDGGQAGD